MIASASTSKRRGGRRKGAGRTPALGDFDRLLIGARCEKLLQDEMKRRKEVKIEMLTRNVSEEWAKARAVAVKDRGAWLQSDAGRDYLEDVEYALREDQGIDAEDDRSPSRGLRVSLRRPKGLSDEIIRKVADEESATRKVPISIHIVKRCWADYRAFVRDESDAAV